MRGALSTHCPYATVISGLPLRPIPSQPMSRATQADVEARCLWAKVGFRVVTSRFCLNSRTSPRDDGAVFTHLGSRSTSPPSPVETPIKILPLLDDGKDGPIFGFGMRSMIEILRTLQMRLEVPWQTPMEAALRFPARPDASPVMNAAVGMMVRHISHHGRAAGIAANFHGQGTTDPAYLKFRER